LTKLGETFFLAEVFDKAYQYFLDAQKYLDRVDGGLKLRFLNTI